MRPSFFAINMLLIFSSIDCSKNPIIPSPTSITDTTSHAFTFQTFTFGGGGGSMLNDVAIVNDTLIYAVGQIYLTDSTGQSDLEPYSIVTWNGVNWQAKKLYDANNQLIAGVRGILVFSPNDIWLADGGVEHWNGVSPQMSSSFGRISLIGGIENGQSVNYLWGTNSNNIYGVGFNGMITYYNSVSWTKIESGTSVQFNDIWGAQNSQTGQWEVLAVAADDVSKKLLRIQGTAVSAVPDSGLTASLYGVWFVPEEKYYLVGAGIGYKSSLDNSLWSVYPSGAVTSYMSGGVRGNGTNDVFVVGSFFEIVHYNGNSWHNYKDVIPFNVGAIGRMAVKGNLMVTVGLSGQNAVAIIGKRE